MKLVAVKGCIINIIGVMVPPEGELPPAGVPIYPPTGSWQISTPPSTDNFVDNNGIYRGTCIVPIPTGSIYGTTAYVTTAPASLTFNGSTIYSTVDEMKILLQDENTATVPISFTMPGSPPTTITVNVTATITVAGQTSTFAE